MYEVDDPIIFSDWNEYFVRTVHERDDTYFSHFLCRYEPKLDRVAKKFIEQYGLDGSRINDLKQIFSIVVWTKLQGYNLDCKLPLLQLVKYDVLYT